MEHRSESLVDGYADDVGYVNRERVCADYLSRS